MEVSTQWGCVVSANKNTVTLWSQDFRFSGRKQRLLSHPSDKVPLLPAREGRGEEVAPEALASPCWCEIRPSRAVCLIDGLVLLEATGAEMLWPSEEVLSASHRAVVLPWNAKAGECKLQSPSALPTHGDQPLWGALPRGYHRIQFTMESSSGAYTVPGRLELQGEASRKTNDHKPRRESEKHVTAGSTLEVRPGWAQKSNLRTSTVLRF